MSRPHAVPSVDGVARVAAPTVAFWVLKGMSTAMGESVSDWSIRAVPPEVAVLVGFAIFGATLALQLTRREYIAWVYWLAVGAVGVFGTMAADVVHVVLGLPYLASFAVYAGLLAALFSVWRRTEGTLDVHTVTTFRRELFYWAAVVLTFAMGTAVGDLTAVTFHWGYAVSMVAFAALILVPALGYRYLSWNGVACFWTAYVLTRPVGASFADWLGKPTSEGGVGVGAGVVGFALVALMVAGVRMARPRASVVAVADPAR